MRAIVYKHELISLIALLQLFACCNMSRDTGSIQIDGYDGTRITVNNLSTHLNEISGIAFDKSNNTFLAINDEEGKIYTLDADFKINSVFRFAESGDYEDIVVRQDTVLVLKSNGDIYQIKQSWSDKPVIKHFAYSGVNAEYETLLFDEPNSRYLLISKSNDENRKNLMYAFDPATGKYQMLHQQIGGKEFNAITGYPGFHPSGACADANGNMYILSSLEHMLVKVDQYWNAVKVYRFNKNLLRKPEGITFDDHSNMYVTSEAAGKKPRLIKLPFSLK